MFGLDMSPGKLSFKQLKRHEKHKCADYKSRCGKDKRGDFFRAQVTFRSALFALRPRCAAVSWSNPADLSAARNV
jgi:hypothetical protein